MIMTLWSLGATCSACFVLYGGYLCVMFNRGASAATSRAISHVAMHDAMPVGVVLHELKTSAFGH